VLLTANGKKLPILKTVMPIVVSGQEYLLESFVPVAHHKQAKEKLQEKTEQLARSNRLCV